MPEPAPVSEAEKRVRLAELQARLAGTQLPDDFTNGSPETVLLRFLAARGFDVDKALTVRAPRWPAPRAAAACVAAGAAQRVGTAEQP